MSSTNQSGMCYAKWRIYAIQSAIWPVNDKIDVDTFDDDFDDEPYVPPTEEELKQMEERRKKSDKISAEIARRMLQGWGLYDF